MLRSLSRGLTLAAAIADRNEWLLTAASPTDTEADTRPTTWRSELAILNQAMALVSEPDGEMTASAAEVIETALQASVCDM